MQVDKIVYFALLLKKCVKAREPSSDTLVARTFDAVLTSFKRDHYIEERYDMNKRSIQYTITMAKELEVIFRNNKLTPWGRTLEYFTPTQIPKELPISFKIFFSKCFLLENYAFAKSLHNHIEEFGEMRDDHSWYKKIKSFPKDGRKNHAFSVYIEALRIAIESVDSLSNRRRYLRLYRQALRRAKTAKALYHKIKPSLGIMEDLNLIKRRKANNLYISLSERNSCRPYTEIIKRFSSYKTIRTEENLLPILLEAHGYKVEKTLSNQEVISNAENLYKLLRDPVFKVCDMNTLINIMVVQHGLQGYQLNEFSVKESIIETSNKNRHKYQILPDRMGRNRFLKIKL